ncbi:hypothetical protein ACFLRW_00600 [Acidobacteriota bacterium]
MNAIDSTIVIFYFIAVIGLGFWYRKRASLSLESYFLGGKKLPWLALAMSGSVSNFDITGTMWIVSIMFVLGMKSMWHHWMWGFLMGAFFLSYMGKWVRRSNVLTAAEWMRTRFGDDSAGRLARTAYASMAVLTLASFVGYAFQGIGKFASVYIPLEPNLLAVLIIGVTTLYVLLGGLFSVVVTDVIQTVVLSVGSLAIAFIAWLKLTPEGLAEIPDGFTSLRVPWKLTELSGTENASQFEFFGALVIVWIMKGLLMNAGGPAQMYDFQRFLAARNERDAAKLGAAWSVFLVVRWAFVMGIVLLALTGVSGVTDSEKVMPLVLKDFLPVGVRGIVVAGLLAAFMSTFSSTVNSGASFIVRDLWQPFKKKQSTERQAVHFSYFATVLLVLFGILIGFQSDSITEIWSWMMMALGGGVLIPNVLRWYWWRMNGWGYALGTFGGILLSLISLFYSTVPDYVVFPLIVTASLLLSVMGSLVTRPVDKKQLIEFYRSIRPFGLWKPVQEYSGLVASERDNKNEKASRSLLNVIFGMIAIASGYLFPMYLVGHWYGRSLLCLGISLSFVFVLKFTWYRHLN